MKKFEDYCEEMDLDYVDTGLDGGTFYDAVERGQSAFQHQGDPSDDEKKERAAERRTQGRKGCSLPRINLSLSSTNHEFVQIMSKVSGMSMNKFVDSVVTAYREEHGETYRKARELLDELKK